MTAIFRIVLAALVLALAVTAAEAGERIPFVEGGLHGDDWEQVKKYLAVMDPVMIEEISEDHGLDREAAWEYFRRFKMFAGRFDINGDGVEELFVTTFYSAVCGTAGCETPIFQMTAKGWQKLSSISPTISDIGGPVIFVSDEVIDGYRTLHTEYTGLHWNGEQYIGYCRRDCTRG